MLGTRIVTAVILLAVLGGSLAVPSPWPFLLLLSLATGVALWEWLRLTSHGGPASVIAGTALGVLTAALAYTWLAPSGGLAVTFVTYDIATRVITPVAVLLWVLLGVYQVVRGDVTAPARNVGLSLFAILALLATWVALAILFILGGAMLLLSFLAIIWVADIGAYFAGRAFGKRKLAVRVSPGKSWEGAIAGVLAAVIWGAVTLEWKGSFANHLAATWSYGALLWIAFLAMLSIVGDLFESLLKRRAGFKDSSNLLPGHGGVLDRVDAILPTAPLALLLIIFGV